ncbi:MarR family transcriptional regulator [Cupriavidus metallidurans]|jgi:hypothetical protein|uniref:DNA-binding protein n=1 Tax=Cupriavidus metallidurans (strain ATCC 43123 / DSM 2839 / NBRC 102507 / CH34) TaxID=266264 RepID=Q1LHZ7_CUPMC|nr:helix-turn-helix domain-containing protein [Cupriavidus metallidurans]ABF10229.1 conserved hypothetical protein [Cupriavidus metallidurans CH34]QGS28985.1 DNA-binding protein [Cupriavidus metallidurans]
MNQTANRVQIRLLDLTDRARPFGNIQGKAVFRAICEIADSQPTLTIFDISLEGIEATDASFPRESVISAAKHYRGQHGFFLTGLVDRDLVDNWKYAAQAKQQPLVIWRGDSFEVIGPDLTASAEELLNYVLTHREVGTAQVAQDLNISVPNASTRLKRLVDGGFLLRRDDIADTGGVEYRYLAIR